MSGVDHSEAMPESARQRLPGLAFSLGDIATWHRAGYERRIEAAHAPRADGRRLLAFARLFIVACRQP